MKLLPGLLLLALGLAAGAPAAQAAAEALRVAATDPRLHAYEEFRRLFAAGDYAAALPLAEEVVRLTEESREDRDQLPIAWNNLGATQLRLSDPAAAEQSYLKALELLEATEGIASRRLIAPLGGLGTAYAAQGRHDLAAVAFEQGLAISRRANGLFNLEQLDLLEALVRSLKALGNVAGVDRERRYALQVVQQKYGYDDPRTVPMLIELARWYEENSRWAPARAQYQLLVAIASREDGGRNAATIEGLLGVARTHRLQFGFDPESMLPSPEGADSFVLESQRQTGVSDPFAPSVVNLDRDGEKAALQALAILEAATDPPPQLLAETLLELGDWYMTAGKPEQARIYYERTWQQYAGDRLPAGQENPLLAPRQLVYRRPAAAIRNRDLPAPEVQVSTGEFDLAIDAQGTVTGVTEAGGDLNEFRSAQIQRALRRSVFSPRFEDGQPVATAAFRFVEYWYDRPPPAEPSDAG